MKCNWTTKKLSEIAYINPRESLGKGVVAKKVPMDKLQPFCRDIPEFVLEEYKGGTKFRNGDTIMARITPCLENGKIAKVSVLSDGEVGFGSTEYIVFRAIDGVSDADFLYYLICSPLVRNPAIKSMVGSSGRQRVQTDVVANLDVELPPIEEQRKIGGLLKAIDDKIELNDVINNNLLQQLHILYSRLFCNSAMDTPLGEVVATTSGGTPSRKHDEYYSDSSICWVKSKELLGNYIHETEEHINDLAIKKSSAKLLPKHSVLIAMYGATVGACGVISKPMTCNQAVCALLCNENYPYTYLFQIAYESQQKFINLAVGSAQQNISQVLIKQLNLHSDLNIIQKFHGLALPMHQEIESLQAENMHLAALRDNLLPKLMSGELDVSNIDL
jgi:type I restriction enzyme S subunit